MKNLLFSLVLLGLAPAATAQSSRSGSYVPPVAPPKTITTYSTSPGYTPPSQMYNAGRVYTPSYSPSKPSAPASPGGDRRTGNAAAEPSPEPTSAGSAVRSATETLADMRRHAASPNYVVAAAAEMKSSMSVYQLRGEDFNLYYVLLAQAQLALGNYEEVIAAAKIPSLPYPTELHEAVMEASFFTKRYSDGVAAFNKCRSGQRLPTPYYLALCQAALGQYQEALPVLTAFRSSTAYRRPVNYDYYLARSLLGAGGNDYRARTLKAIDCLGRFLAQAGPDRHDALLLRGRAYQSIGDYPRCVADATQELERDPKNVDVLSMRAQAYAALKQYPAALLDQSALIAYDDKSAGPWGTRSRLRNLSGDYAGALSDAQEAFRRDSTGLWGSFYLSDRASAYFKLGRYQACIDDCTRAMQLSSARSEECLMRGQAYLKLNNRALACASFKQVLTQWGNNVYAQESVAAARRLQLASCGTPHYTPSTKKPSVPARKPGRKA